MRLTLRTLLAYLEDELKPAESKEIGQKIAESPVATSLAQRIREVMRRRRLSAEDLNETGLDPNLVAEYLDGALTAQEVADVERVCLGSDAHLAEVAACHQILTLVLGDPVEISEESRERMYALADDGTVAKSDIPVPAQQTTAPAKTPESSPFQPQLPRKPWWQSIVPLLVPLVLVGIWLVLIRFDPSLNFFAASPGETEQGIVVAAADPIEREANNQVPEVVPKQEEEPEPVEMTATPGSPDQNIDPPPPPDKPEPGADSETVDDQTAEPIVAETPPESSAGNIPETPGKKSTPKTTSSEEPAAETRQVVGRYRSTEGVLLSFDDTKRSWYPVPYELELEVGDELAVPAPFSALLEIAGNGPLLELKGATRGKLMTDSPAAERGLELYEGRVVLEALNPQPDPFAFRTGSLDWRLELIQPDTRVGLEMIPLRVYGFERSAPANHFQLRVVVSSGVVRLVSETGQVTVNEGQQVVLHDPTIAIDTPKGETSNSPPPPRPEPGTLTPEMVASTPLTPDWLQSEQPVISTIQQMYIDEFATRFNPDLPAEESLEVILEDPRPRIAQYTVICLGLIDSLPELIKVMRNSEFEDARLAAANEVSLWLSRHPGERGEYLSRLHLSFPGEEAEHLNRLLWGYSIDDARDPIASSNLVKLLDHDRLMISELAFLEMARLTGLEEAYKALITPSQRRAWTNRWNRLIRDEGTILPADVDE